jgi:hypothetical protein
MRPPHPSTPHPPPGDVFGDFEDVEAGLTFTGGDAVTAAAAAAISAAKVCVFGGGGVGASLIVVS